MRMNKSHFEIDLTYHLFTQKCFEGNIRPLISYISLFFKAYLYANPIED